MGDETVSDPPRRLPGPGGQEGRGGGAHYQSGTSAGVIETGYHLA